MYIYLVRIKTTKEKYDTDKNVRIIGFMNREIEIKRCLTVTVCGAVFLHHTCSGRNNQFLTISEFTVTVFDCITKNSITVCPGFLDCV